jgi:iron complex outermembrane receptor protein
MDTTPLRRLLTGVLAVWSVDPGVVAAAPDASTARAPPVAELEEVVVTARRREERLHDVPVAVSVLPGAELERRQVVEFNGLQYAVPNMTVTTDQTNRATTLVALRGHFEPNSVPTVDPTAGIYLDGVYIARITGANMRLLDMERAEVLRGPQGTLFGRNTIGGAINLLTHAPTPRFEGWAEAVLGNYDRRELAGVANLPLASGRGALRIVASHAEHAGFGYSTLLDRDLDDEDTDYLRARFTLAVTDSLALDLSADYTHFDNGGQLRTLLAASASSSLVTAASGHPEDDIQDYVGQFRRKVPANRAGAVSTEAGGLGLTLAYAGPSWTLRSITGARRLTGRAADNDQDATPYDLGGVLVRSDSQQQFSQELQLSGRAFDDRLQWIGGLHYFVEEATFTQSFIAFVPAASGWNENRPDGDARNDSTALYAQVSYALAPAWRLTAGVRVNRDGRQLTSRNSRIEGGVDTCTLDPDLLDEPGTCRATLPRRTFDDVPYTIGLDFRPAERTLLYGKVSRGYRAGGYNLRGATEVTLGTFGPENVTAWEVGARADLLDNRLRLDLALFRSYFDDIQLVQREVTDGPTQLFLQNGGQARLDGGELELAALLGPVRLTGSLGLIDARFTQLDPHVIGVTPDSEFLNTPAATASLAIDVPLLVGTRRFDLHVDYAWRDDTPYSYNPASPARQEAYALWNARIAADTRWPGLQLVLWGRNLTDEQYLTRALEAGTYISSSLGDPRTWGFTLRYRFGER